MSGGAPAEEVPTYGGWRRSRGVGLLGLTSGQTVVLLLALTLQLITVAVSPTVALVAGGPVALVVASTLLRWDGAPVLHAATRRLRWLWGSLRGYSTYRSGITAAHAHAWQLPGVLAATQLLEITDAGGDYGLVRHRRLGTATATWKVAATSTWLVDRDQARTWVANWGGWLAGLGYLSVVRWVSVTVATAPASGSRLADYVTSRMAPHAPAAAQRVLTELLAGSPDAAADVDTWVSVTVDPSAAPARAHGAGAAAAELSRILPGLQDSLASTGVSVLGRATAGDLTSIVRGAFDPHVRAEAARLRDTPATPHRGDLVDWDTAGPVAAEEHYDHYRHDGAYSVSWAWHEAPRSHVHADVLARLLAPSPYLKRVSLLYRPFSAGQAARVVEQEVNATAFRDAMRAAQRRDENARDRADKERALRAAREEATGSGVGLMSLFVTVTVTDAEELPRAVADVESRAEIAKIRLRRLWAGQATGFATTLPCGICPPQLATHWPR